MKESTHKDPFKDRIKTKMDDSPVHKNREEELWSKVIGDIEEDEKKVGAKTRKLHPVIWYASAASLVIGLLAGIIYWKGISNDSSLADKSNQKEHRDLKDESKSTDNTENPGEEKKTDDRSKEDIKSSNDEFLATTIEAKESVTGYDLPDGSHLTLNKEAIVKLTDDFKKARSLSMQGEVYFEIEPDKNKPFNIYFNNHRLLVVGTKFNIRNISGEAYNEISVTEGVVKIFPGNTGKGIEVKAGQQVKLIPNEKPDVVNVDPYNFIFWKTGILDFKNSSMEEVAVVLSRKFKQAVKLNSAIGNCTFTGDLTELSLDETIKIIEITTSYKVEKRKHEVYITGESCK